jgi:hypothetical protein
MNGIDERLVQVPAGGAMSEGRHLAPATSHAMTGN